jgi:hypothetical protein
MARRKTPGGGPKPDKLMRDALALELHQEVKLTTGEKVKKLRLVAPRWWTMLSMATPRRRGNASIVWMARSRRACMQRVATSPSPGFGQRIDVLKPLKPYFRRSSGGSSLFFFGVSRPSLSAQPQDAR